MSPGVEAHSLVLAVARHVRVLSLSPEVPPAQEPLDLAAFSPILAAAWNVYQSSTLVLQKLLPVPEIEVQTKGQLA